MICLIEDVLPSSFQISGRKISELYKTKPKQAKNILGAIVSHKIQMGKHDMVKPNLEKQKPISDLGKGI